MNNKFQSYGNKINGNSGCALWVPFTEKHVLWSCLHKCSHCRTNKNLVRIFCSYIKMVLDEAMLIPPLPHKTHTHTWNNLYPAKLYFEEDGKFFLRNFINFFTSLIKSNV
jgi:hypothetical protein